MRCIGHGGASALAPGNSLASLGLAARLGADAVEFDVRLVRGRLVLAHTVADAFRPGCVELDDALRFLAADTRPELALVVDLKSAGCEQAVLDALRRHGLLDRAWLSSQCRPILQRVRVLEPRARTAMSVAGVVSRSVQRWGAWREVVLADLRARRYGGLMVHRRLAETGLVERVHEAGGQIHAWTVRDSRALARLEGLGLDGVVTTDPRLVVA